MVSAEDIVDEFIDIVGSNRLAWKSMLNVTLAIAQADPRYYGVDDPVRQQQCVACRKVKDLTDFRPNKLRCSTCEKDYA
jgi:hypothetical protein